MSRKVHIVFRLLNFLYSEDGKKLPLLEIDKLLLINLASHHGDSGIFPLQKTMASELNITLRYAEIRIKYLKSINIISITKVKNRNNYMFLCIDQGTKEPEPQDGHEGETIEDQPEPQFGHNPNHSSVDTRTTVRVDSLYIINSNKNPKKNKRKFVENPDELFVLPDWLASCDWDDFVAHRKAIKKPMTNIAKKKMLAKMSKLKSEGHDVLALMEKSMIRGWQDIFVEDKKVINITGAVKKESYHDKLREVGEELLSGEASPSAFYEIPSYMGQEMGSKH